MVEHYYTLPQLAQKLPISADWLRDALKRFEFAREGGASKCPPVVMLGGHFMVSQTAVIQFLQKFASAYGQDELTRQFEILPAAPAPEDGGGEGRANRPVSARTVGELRRKVMAGT